MCRNLLIKKLIEDCSNRTHYRSFGRLRGIHKMRYIEFLSIKFYRIGVECL